jgi:RNA polymerase-binding transcription factor DksA
MYDYLIVGAGLFGSIFARELTDNGYKCLVIDKRDVIKANTNFSIDPLKAIILGFNVSREEDIKELDLRNVKIIEEEVIYKLIEKLNEWRENKRKEIERSTETLVKYSDAELAEFRDLISKKLEAARKELVYLQGLITRKDELGGDNDDARYMTMEDGSISMEREQLGQMASRQLTFIDHLEKALMRIQNKTYGICRVTGRLIDKARLRAVPHATLSLEAKLGYVKNSSEQ